MPMQKGQVEMYLSGEWHTVHLKTAANGLDVDTLETTILQPLLGIKDVRTDKRIDFVGGIRGTQELERLVEFRRRRRGVFDVSGVGEGPDARRRRGRHHAAEVHLVRAEASRRLVVAFDLIPARIISRR